MGFYLRNIIDILGYSRTISIFGVYRLSAFILLRFLPYFLYRPIREKDTFDNTKILDRKYFTKEDVTYIIPVYMPDIGFKECLKSWIINQPKEILLVVDTTSMDSINKILEELQDDEEVNQLSSNVRIIEEFLPGKRAALFTGYKNTTTDIIIFVDDDSLQTKDFLEHMLHPFNYKKKEIGGVGCKQLARPKPGKSRLNIWELFMDMRLFQRFMIIKATTFMDGGAMCISGRSMAFRKAIFDENENFEDEFLNEKFFGQQQLSGDDKCLTRMCVKSRFGMYHQIDEHSLLYTTFEEPPMLFKQMMRWARNTWRSDFKLLFLERTVWCKHPYLAIIMLDTFISAFGLLFGPFFIAYSLINDIDGIYTLYESIIWIIIIRLIKFIPYLVWELPRRPVLWIFLVPFFTLYQYFTGALKVWALFTLKNRKWGNRDVKVGDDNKIVRTGDKADIAKPIEIVECDVEDVVEVVVIDIEEDFDDQPIEIVIR